MNELSRIEQAVAARRTGQKLTQLTAKTCTEQATIRAISNVSEFAISEVQYLKLVQQHAEQSNVDATEAIAAIVNMTVASIARRVAQFGNEVGR
jgi:hypothetical protein